MLSARSWMRVSEPHSRRVIKPDFARGHETSHSFQQENGRLLPPRNSGEGYIIIRVKASGEAMDSQGKTPKLLDQVRQAMRLHHYSLHTERAYLDWIKRYVRFHQMQRREDLAGGEAKIEAFLTDLAVNGHVASATQNQAMNALVFLYKRVLEVPLDQAIQAVRADRRANVPVVLTREEVAKVIPLVDGVAHLVVKLLYGSGLRIMEAVRLRVKDVDLAMKQITVRSGKGDKDRVTTFAGLADSTAGKPFAEGEGGSRAGFGDGAWGGVAAGRTGAQVSERQPGMGLAVCVSGAGGFDRSADGGGAPTPCGAWGGEQGDQGGGAPGRIDQGDQRAQLPSQLRHAFAATRDGHSDHSGVVGSPGCGHDDDLHPYSPTGRAGSSQPAG